MSVSKKGLGAIVQRHGVTFRVWAPHATAVAVTGSFNDWQHTPLQAEPDGYWSAHVAEALPGHEYKYAITRGKEVLLRNDPRALHFTTTPGNSVIVDPAFDWGDDHFMPIPFSKQVIYELHVGTFNRPDPSTSGTFGTAIEKLDYLAELGVNMIELMPISSMLMDRGWGYALDYIFAVESMYGGRHEFLEFVKAAHQRGMGVILDVVYNHFGPDASLDLWQFDGWHQDNRGGIYFYNDWRAETPWGSTRPDFGRPEVMDYLVDNVKMWMHDCRVDGLRVDSTIFIRNAKGYNNDPSTDLPDGWKLLQNITTVSRKINPAALVIAEDIADNDYITKPTSEGGAGFTAQWELNYPHALREALHSSNPTEVNLTGITGELAKRYNDDVFQKVIFCDSHDSAANGGARLNEAVAPGKATGLFARKQSLLAAAILMSAPGIPMLFQGQEFMETGSFNDWQAIDWHKAEQFAGILQAHQHLIALRKNVHGHTAGLAGHNINISHVDENNKVLGYHRWDNGGPADDVMVVVNFANVAHAEYSLSFPCDGLWHVRFCSIWNGYSPDFKDMHVPDVEVALGGGTLVLPPSCAVILSQDS